jgi:hypothetical protein
MSSKLLLKGWYVYKILKTSPEELSDLVSLTNADLETTINAAR